MPYQYSKYRKTPDAKTFSVKKMAILLILCSLTITAVIYGKNIFDRNDPVPEVKSLKHDEIGRKAECPLCRHKFFYDEFKCGNGPNMRSCPNCEKPIPEPYLLRQCFN